MDTDNDELRATRERGKTACMYCEGDIWTRKTIESDLNNEYIVGDKVLLIANWTPAFDGYNAECNWEAELPINYCPMCGRKLV